MLPSSSLFVIPATAGIYFSTQESSGSSAQKLATIAHEDEWIAAVAAMTKVKWGLFRREHLIHLANIRSVA